MPEGGAALDLRRPATEPLARISEIVATSLAPLAERIDREGFNPAEVLRAFGREGAFAFHLSGHTSLASPDLGLSILAMAAMGAECMSTAFCAWCQDACGWYLENSDNDWLRAELQGGIADASLLGGTGLSNPMKALAGIEGFKLKARRCEGGYVVSGALPWVSNLGDGHWFGTIFEDAADPAHRIMAMVRCGQPGVEIRASAHFVALEGTGTYGVMFKRAFIPDAHLLADPLSDMARRIRPGFVLLQTGMGLGVIEGCINDMRHFDVTLAHTNKYLPHGPSFFADELSSLRERILALAETPNERAPDYLRDVLRARLNVSELTLLATQAAILHGGARGYLEGSTVERRQREGNFVAIITPSIRHLRQELASMSQA